MNSATDGTVSQQRSWYTLAISRLICHMLNWIKRRIGSKKSQALKIVRHTYGPNQHAISDHMMSANALRVIEKLADAGFEAYIVGGGVRDSLLGMRPKDFDVATSATPEQVRNVFRNSRIIGRRFRIVHVVFGRDIIEVTTFRGHHDNASGKEAQAAKSGMLIRDNVYGTLEEDAIRRDFTVNALYYDLNGNVLDFTDGMDDIKQRRLRIIGDPVTRYREDPVRMLRAVRLAAKLDFEIDQPTREPIAELAGLLSDISSSRLFDESLKLFLGGAALATYELLRAEGLFGILFPATAKALAREPAYENLIRQALINTDERIHKGLRVTPAFLFAAFLWPALQQRTQDYVNRGSSPYQAQQDAASRVITEQIRTIAIPKRFTQPMQEIWQLQQHLPRRSPARAQRLLEHPRFRAAYDFVLLREQAGENLDGLGEWWTKYQEANPIDREALLQNAPPAEGAARRRPRKRRAPKTDV